MQKMIGVENRLPNNDLNSLSLCAWCGCPEIIGNYPVVIDKSRVIGLNFGFLKNEDHIYNFYFPICRQCKQEIKTRRILDNRAIQLIVVIGILSAIVLSITQHNIGLSIFASFSGSVIGFGFYLLIKNCILSVMKYASEKSWGSFDGVNFSFRNKEFSTLFNKLNRKKSSFDK
jgi:uncharacterized protein (DUF983 family)